mmetsp:Transcript_18483/g.26589  ORF Transcript_18483/g.26589 Transcript_18483/m.26589 type:complete len:405 (-) Transcript_18483:371-1585(-)
MSDTRAIRIRHVHIGPRCDELQSLLFFDHKHEEDDEELELLQNEDIKMDNEAIMRVVQKEPMAACSRFYQCKCVQSVFGCSPIYLAMQHQASLDVIKTLYRANPGAIMERYNNTETLLHIACREYRESPELVSFLLEECFAAIYARDADGQLPLHSACWGGASIEIVSLLLEKYPAAAQEEDSYGIIPARGACGSDASVEILSLLLENYTSVVGTTDHHGYKMLIKTSADHAPLDVILFLLEKFPEAAEMDKEGLTPLHFACMTYAPLYVLKSLLKYGPHAVTKQDDYGHTPIDYWDRAQSYDTLSIYDEGKMILSGICCLVDNDHDDDYKASAVKKVVNDFIEIMWWDGVALVFNLFPKCVQQCLKDFPMTVSPSVLHMMGRRCKIWTMWHMIKERQDLLKTV